MKVFVLFSIFAVTGVVATSARAEQILSNVVTKTCFQNFNGSNPCVVKPDSEFGFASCEVTFVKTNVHRLVVLTDEGETKTTFYSELLPQVKEVTSPVRYYHENNNQALSEAGISRSQFLNELRAQQCN